MKESTTLSRACLARLQVYYDTLKSAEKAAADYLLSNPAAFARGPAAEVARAAGCSAAAVVRLAKRLGYRGYAHMKGQLFAPDDPLKAYQDITPADSVAQAAQKVFDACIRAAQDTIGVLDPVQYTRAVEALSHVGSILFAGAGDAGIAAQAGFSKLGRLGLRTLYSQDYDHQAVMAAGLKPGDVLVAVTYSGRTVSTLAVMQCAKQAGATVIVITNAPTSPAAKRADIVLTTSALHDGAMSEMMTKRIPELCLIESLYINLLRTDAARIESVERMTQVLAYNKRRKNET